MREECHAEVERMEQAEEMGSGSRSHGSEGPGSKVGFLRFGVVSTKGPVLLVSRPGARARRGDAHHGFESLAEVWSEL